MKAIILSRDFNDIRLIRLALSNQDVQVLNVDNQEAVYSLLKENNDLVLFAEYDHPSLNGLELINHLLALQIPLFPFIVFITEKGQGERVLESLGPVPGDVIHKPLDRKDVELRLHMAERTLAMQKRMQANVDHINAGVTKYDELTNVLNRQAVYEQALAELDRAQRENFEIVVALVEVLNLEKIYKEYGSEIRDQVVRFIARAARANLRSYDLVGRWIGGKFLLVLPGVNQENAEPALKRIHLAMTTVRVRVSDAKRISLEVRIGYAISGTGDHNPLYELVDQANQALLSASITKDLTVVGFTN